MPVAILAAVIVWLNGTHGIGKTTTSALVAERIRDSRVFDAEKVGETLMDIRPPLPETDDFQHRPPWRPLVVETARRILEYTGGTLVIPMTVPVEAYGNEISTGLAAYGITVHHVVLHADHDTLRDRIINDPVMGPSTFRLSRLDASAAACDRWLSADAEVIDTTDLSPAEVADVIVASILSPG